MKIIFRSYILVVILFLFLSTPQKVFSFKKPENLKEIGIFAGSLRDRTLSEKDDYLTVPVGLRFGFDIKPLIPLIKKFKFSKYIFKKASLLEFTVEPFMAGIVSPDSNFETGCGLLLKYGYRWCKFLPFIDAGTGFQYTTQHTREEATQWCFQVQGGAGFYYFFQKNKAVSFEYRFRHFSNAGTKEPNKGVDVYGFYIGFSYFFN